MNSEYSQTGVHWAIKALAIALLFVGLPQLLGGIYLIALGGSWYYLLAGAGICASAIMLWRGRELGISIYLAVLAFTILWSLYEVGFSFWGSVPRLVAPLAIGATLLFFSPLLRGAEQPRASMRPSSPHSGEVAGLASFHSAAKPARPAGSPKLHSTSGATTASNAFTSLRLTMSAKEVRNATNDESATQSSRGGNCLA